MSDYLKKVYILEGYGNLEFEKFDVMYSEHQVLDFCKNNDFWDVKVYVYLAYEYKDYMNDLLDDIDSIDCFNPQDLAPQSHNNALSLV